MTTPFTPPPDQSPDRITPGKSIEPLGGPGSSQQPAGFESYMKGTPTQPQNIQTGTPGGPSPLDLSRGGAFQSGAPTFNSLLAQAKNAQDSLGTVGQQLKEPNLKLKRSQSHLLKNKLSDANEYIRTAAGKVGVEAPPFKMPSGATGIDRFLAYVNDGQTQLMAVQQKLKDMSASGQQLNAGEMMMVQVKMGLAQQEIEYSSTLLGKVVDMIKTIINIQL